MITFKNEDERRYWHLVALTILRSENILHHADAAHYADSIIKEMRQREPETNKQLPLTASYISAFDGMVTALEKFRDEERLSSETTEALIMALNTALCVRDDIKRVAEET